MTVTFTLSRYKLWNRFISKFCRYK